MSASNTTPAFDRRVLLKSAVVAALSAPAIAEAQPQRVAPTRPSTQTGKAYQAIDD